MISVAMEIMELEVETELSKRPALEPNDSTALTKEQQDKLNQHKVKRRIENEQYMRRHPEISVVVSSFVSDVLLKRPQNIPQYAAEYFTDPSLEDRMKTKVKNTHNTSRTQ